MRTVTVTCDCGKVHEVVITKKMAAGIMSAGRKLPSKEQAAFWGAKGGKKRWEGHVKQPKK